MCWIGFAPKDRSQIPGIHLQRAHHRNDDAWGIMFAADGRVHVSRDVSGHDGFREAWKAAPARTSIACHFRYGTSGAMDSTMAHPFPILEDGDGVKLAMMHNGVMSCVYSEGGLSDTAVFVRDVLQPQLEARPDLIELDGWRAAMGAILGEDNKLVFCRADGRFFFVNGYQGEWQKAGTWYSNIYSIEEPKAPAPKPLSSTLAPYFSSDVSSFGKRAWDGLDGDWTQEPSGLITRKLATLDEDAPEQADNFPEIPNLSELSEQEVFEFVCEATPEDVTDAILDLISGTYRR
jgi:hypothetical protein